MKSIAVAIAMAICLHGPVAGLAKGQQPTGAKIVDVADLESDVAPAAFQEAGSVGQNQFATIRLDTDFFAVMLNFQNRQSDKELVVLEDKVQEAGFPAVALGGQARLSLLAAATNTTGKFGYLGRFPGDFEGDTATDARLLQANAGLIAHVNPWVSVYGETLFSDVFSFPDFKQGSLQVRQAYAVFGDLDQSPFYGFLGKKNVSFGDMGTLSPFSQSVVWHYFGALHEGVGVGYAQGGLNLALTGLNGGRGIRVADSESRGRMNNFAVDATLRGGDDAVGFRLGGGYLLGTIYDAGEAEHLDPNAFGPYNGAWDVNAEVYLGQLILAGEFVSTVNEWPVTEHPVMAYRAEAAFDARLLYRPARYSVSWSEGIQGPRGSQFEFNQQLVLGLGVNLGPNALLSAEYVRSMGFAPLINITQVSDRNVAQDSLVLGMTVLF